MHFIDADKSTSGGVEIIYGILTNFRDIVNRFYSNGLMSERLLELVEAETVDDLRDSQPAGASIALLSKENTPDSVLLTLIAIKILQVFFVDHQRSWFLVEQKAKAAALTTAGYDLQDFETLLAQVNPCFSVSIW